IKDPEALLEMDGELLRQARAALADVPEDLRWQGRQPRLVRADGTISVRDREFGPLSPDLVGMSVDVEVRDEALEVYYNRALRARFNNQTGEALPLDDDFGDAATAVPASSAAGAEQG
ncbi:MAG: hypothetical protein M3411_04685, partial [Chloroflexota bacterium]|nr:hypothetical protein [Chloroflexota bacterium]